MSCLRNGFVNANGTSRTVRLIRTAMMTTLMLALFALAFASLSGCASQGQGQGQSSSQGTQAHEPLTVCNVNELFSDAFIAEFQKAHPEVQFDASCYAGMNSSGFTQRTLEHGDIPDIYLSTYMFSPEAQKEYLIDLSGYSFINNYTATMLNDMDNDGGIYLLPGSYQMTGICYNKTLMEKHGWEVPSSFQDLEELAPKIEAAGYDVMRCAYDLDGYPFNFYFNITNTSYFHTAEGSQWKADFSSGKARAAGNLELLESTEYFKRWVDEGFIKASEEGTGFGPRDAFMNGECVFYMCLGITDYEHTTEDGRTYEFGVMPWLSEDGSSNTLTVTMSRYFGLNKELLEPGNEQKLADALTLMEFISSPEGQQAFAEQSPVPSLYMSPLTGGEMSADSPFYDLRHLIEQGHTVQLAYVGWEDLIVPMAQDIRLLVSGDITPEELLEAFDASYEEAVVNDGSFAVAKEDASLDDAIRLSGVSIGTAANADAALVSVGGFNEARERNDCGVGWYFYAGGITLEEINMFSPRGDAIAIFEMTGAEIKDLAEAGFDLYGNGNAFEYVLVAKDGFELEDDQVYRLAIGTSEVAEGMQPAAIEVVDMRPRDAVVEYVSTLGSFSMDDIRWS